MDNIQGQEASPQVAIVPTPGMGHLIPLVELAKKLVHQHNFSVTFIVPNDGSPMKPQRQILQALPKTMSSVFLPPVNFDDLPPNVLMETRITLSLTRSLDALRNSLKTLTDSTRVVAMVVDLFGPFAIEIAKEFDVLPFVFFPANAMLLSLSFHLPKLDETYSGEYKDMTEPLRLPGCVPVQGRDLVDAVQDREDDAYKWILHICKLYDLAAGIIVNSFIDLEPGGLKALMEENNNGKPPVYPVGPLIQTGSTIGDVGESECLSWLDKQPKGSVLFVSFGSGGTLSHAQLNELSLGLEMSGQRFLWVVRSPHDKAANGTYFGIQSTEDPLAFLPEGFLDRTKGVGLVVPSWAPQMQVLSHGSTGGFLTHCGWNSILESIVNGVPLIAWPLYAEQKMNSVLLADGLKVAVKVKVGEDGLVRKEDIANYARSIFEGEEGKLMKSKMSGLKSAATRVLSQDGSSTRSLAGLARIWKDHKK
ncbi:hydroquinone glucosyltransferase [Salix suchowensis]|nr:hydroquinone glucosyltransferase [Salix suchowensis]